MAREAPGQREARLRRTLATIEAENGGKPAAFTTATMARLYPDLYPPPARLVTVRGQVRRVRDERDVVRAMGEAMLDFALAGGAATEQDLKGCGFTAAELAAHADAARVRARELMREAA